MFRLLLLVCGLLLVASPALAIEFSAPTPTRTYEPISLGNDPITIREYYGELTGDPIMYEVVALEEFTLQAVLEQPQRGEPLPLRLLVVREVAGGRVETVVRSGSGGWEAVAEPWLGLSWWRIMVGEADIPPGTYRIEVSSAENIGSYRLTVGTEAPPGNYVGMWQRLWFVKDYYDQSVVTFLTTRLVLVHVGFVAVVWLFWWLLLPRLRRRVSHITA
jgi:hypothetical protein